MKEKENSIITRDINFLPISLIFFVLAFFMQMRTQNLVERISIFYRILIIIINSAIYGAGAIFFICFAVVVVNKIFFK